MNPEEVFEDDPRDVELKTYIFKSLVKYISPETINKWLDEAFDNEYNGRCLATICDLLSIIATDGIIDEVFHLDEKSHRELIEMLYEAIGTDPGELKYKVNYLKAEISKLAKAIWNSLSIHTLDGIRVYTDN